MGLLKTTTVGLIGLVLGIFIGIIFYVVLGGETKEPEWKNWMYFPCYIIPTIAMIFGLRIGSRIDRDIE